jgi:Tfp pilus assembly protein PilF
VPPRIAEGEDYDKCLSMLNADPSGAFVFADTWAGAGGGGGALHCRALAQVALGDAAEGAAGLDQVAETSSASPAARAAVLGQAVQSWMMAGEPKRAYDSASKALALMPDEPDLQVDRAIAGIALDKFQEAADDLSRALETDPRRGDALVLRASCWRNLGQLDLADDDVERALALDPDDPDALLERGILRQRRGNPTGARHDWERAVALAPDTATADLAQQNLALLEAGPERR